MNKLIVKDNILIQANYALDTVEQRIILLAILEVGQKGKVITTDTLIQIHASSYADHFKTEMSAAYKALLDASKKLYDRSITYEDSNPQNGNDRSFQCRWVDKIGYEKNSASIYLRFSKDIVPLITQLETSFTQYEIRQIANLTSPYAIRLYEMLIRWRGTQKLNYITLEDFREQLGVSSDRYKVMSDFKKNVFEPAINQINEHTDIMVNYIQHKSGRQIIGFSFDYQFKKVQEDQNGNVSFNSDSIRFYPFSDAQLDLFATKLAELPEIQAKALPGEEMKTFINRLKDMLIKDDQQKYLIPYLEKVGFKHNYKGK